MKKILSFILAVSTLCGTIMLTSSCEKMLETKVYGQIVPETFFQSESDLQAAVVGMMIYVSGRGAGTDYGLWTSHWVAPRIYGLSMSDELYRQYSAWSRWTWTPSSGIEDNGGGRPEDNWAVWQFNRVSAKITSLLQDFQNCPVAKSNPALVEEYSRQLKGLRALYMYTLYEFFGPVNTIIDPSHLNEIDPQPRMTEAEYRASIESDLAAVLESNLPDKYTGDMRGYITKDFFRMLSIRYYMATEQWGKAEAVCRYLLSSGNYKLITTPGATVTTADVIGVDNRVAIMGPSYSYTYSPFEVAINTCPNDETIFSCPVDNNHGNIWITEITSGSYFYTPGPSAGTLTGAWHMGWTPWEHFHSLFGYEGDESYELDTRVRQFYTKAYNRISGKLMVENPGPDELSMNGAYPYKFTNYKEAGHSGAEWLIEQPAYRLSDVYLYLAEAIVRQKGVTSEAIELVNSIRSRAGLGTDIKKHHTPYYVARWGSDPTASKDAFLHLILWERGRELMGEGQRYEDLKRFTSPDGTNMLVERAYEQKRISDKAANAYRVLAPLPHKVVLQSHGIVVQNPGYPTTE